MARIELETEIHAPIEICFDVSRDVGVHELSAVDTKERAISGRTSGLCALGDEITWEAVHFGIKQQLTVRITEMEVPHFFEDIMIKGAFRSMTHGHFFEDAQGKTIMKDVFEYQVPAGMLGKLFDHLILKHYMARFLRKRNDLLKQVSEEKTQLKQ